MRPVVPGFDMVAMLARVLTPAMSILFRVCVLLLLNAGFAIEEPRGSMTSKHDT